MVTILTVEPGRRRRLVRRSCPRIRAHGRRRSRSSPSMLVELPGERLRALLRTDPALAASVYPRVLQAVSRRLGGHPAPAARPVRARGVGTTGGPVVVTDERTALRPVPGARPAPRSRRRRPRSRRRSGQRPLVPRPRQPRGADRPAPRGRADRHRPEGRRTAPWSTARSDRVDELPAGIGDEQSPGHYRLVEQQPPAGVRLRRRPAQPQALDVPTGRAAQRRAARRQGRVASSRPRSTRRASPSSACAPASSRRWASRTACSWAARTRTRTTAPGAATRS